jgi:hypothetical protein
MMIVTWQDDIKSFKTKHKKGHGAAATLLLMYLSFGKDYPYNIHKKIKDNLTVRNGWSIEKLEFFKKITNCDSLYVLLDDMKKKEFLQSGYDEDEKHFYWLNPKILYFLDPPSGYCGWHQRDAEIKWVKNDITIYRFLGGLEKRDRLNYFKIWSTIEPLDFVAFIDFLAKEAVELHMEEMANILKKNGALLRGSEEERIKNEAVKKYRSNYKKFNTSNKILYKLDS